MEEENDDILQVLEQCLQINDRVKCLKRLNNYSDSFTNTQLLQTLNNNFNEYTFKIVKEFTNNFSTLQSKELSILILILCTQENVDLNMIIEVDQILPSNQFVGMFINKYENSIKNNNNFDNQGIIDHITQNKKNVINFKLVFNTIFQLARQNKLQIKQLQELINKEEQIQIIVDKPIIKIIPLTPRIKQMYLPKRLQDKSIQDNIQSKQEELRKLQKKRLLTKKQLMKEIYQDQNQLHQIKHEIKNHKISKQKEQFKKGLRMLEEQQLELKRLKTMQINIKRHKKKSTRKAGNKS